MDEKSLAEIEAVMDDPNAWMTEQEEAEYWRTHGPASTPGCDCGHDGLGSAWHLQDCVWRRQHNAPE